LLYLVNLKKFNRLIFRLTFTCSIANYSTPGKRYIVYRLSSVSWRFYIEAGGPRSRFQLSTLDVAWEKVVNVTTY